MRNGFKIYDSDTHLSPSAETLEPYFDASMRQRLPEWESCKVPFRIGWAGEKLAAALSPPLPVYQTRRLARGAAGFGRSGTAGTYRAAFPDVHG